MKKRIFTLAFAIFLPLFAFPCDCPRPGSIEQEYKTSSKVFSGKVTNIIKGKRGLVEAVFRVGKGIKNTKSGKIITVKSSSGDCNFILKKGKTYLVYTVNEVKKGIKSLRILASHCGRSKELNDSAMDEFIKLRKLQKN